LPKPPELEDIIFNEEEEIENKSNVEENVSKSTDDNEKHQGSSIS
jgi:hypothetical protein